MRLDKFIGIKVIAYNKYPESVFNILQIDLYVDDGKEWVYVER